MNGLLYLLDQVGAELAKMHDLQRENARLRALLGIPDGMPVEMIESMATPRTADGPETDVLAGLARPPRPTPHVPAPSVE